MFRKPWVRITCIGLALLGCLGGGIVISMFNRGIEARTDIPLLDEFAAVIIEKRAAGEVPTDGSLSAAKLQELGDVGWKDPYRSGIRPIIKQVSSSNGPIVVDVDIEERSYRLEIKGEFYEIERISRAKEVIQ